MAVAIVKKGFEDQNKPGLEPSSYTSTLEKFLLKILNRLSHNCEGSGPLIAGFLLHLPDHYTPNALVKSINISMLKTKFLLLIFGQNFNTINNIACVNGGKCNPILYLSIINTEVCVSCNYLCINITKLY